MVMFLGVFLGGGSGISTNHSSDMSNLVVQKTPHIQKSVFQKLLKFSSKFMLLEIYVELQLHWLHRKWCLEKS